MNENLKDRLIPWVDPQTKKPLLKKGNYLVSENNKFKIYDGILNLSIAYITKKQNQVSKSFGYKWTNSNFGQNDREFETKLKDPILGFMGILEKDLSFLKNKTILDIGVGSVVQLQDCGQIKQKNFMELIFRRRSIKHQMLSKIIVIIQY